MGILENISLPAWPSDAIESQASLSDLHPAFLGKVHVRFRTPSNALLVNMGIGMVALLTGKTGEIITISVFGALSLYIISMVALLRLRKKEPSLARPFKVPFYPTFPIIALVIAVVSLLSMTVYNTRLALLYFVLIGISCCIFKVWTWRRKLPAS